MEIDKKLVDCIFAEMNAMNERVIALEEELARVGEMVHPVLLRSEMDRRNQGGRAVATTYNITNIVNRSPHRTPTTNLRKPSK